MVKNTSEGINTIANGIAWKPGDRVVAFREEFPSNWLPLEESGITRRRGAMAPCHGSSR
jgi:selenocysteine lyase/cysteine desulfurase